MRDFIDGLLAIPRSFRLLGTKKVLNYVLISAVFGLVVGVSLVALLYFYYDDLGDLLTNLYPWEWGSRVVAAVSKWMALLFGLIMLVFFFKYLIIILLAPILSYISEVIEEEITGQKSKPFSIPKVLRELGRSIRINLRNIWKELLYTVLLFFLGLFTGLSFITAPVILLIQAYYMGFGNLDFLLERHLNFSESVRFVRNNRMLAIGNGLGFLILFAIPVIGFLLAPVLSVIGATVEGLERLEE